MTVEQIQKELDALNARRAKVIAENTVVEDAPKVQNRGFKYKNGFSTATIGKAMKYL